MPRSWVPTKEVAPRSLADLGLAAEGDGAVGGAATRTTIVAKRTPPARGAARVVRGSAADAARDVVAFLAERRLI